MRTLQTALAAFVDVLILLLAAAILFVILTGGSVFEVLGSRISLTSAGNPITFLLILSALRWWLGRSRAFLGISRLRVDRLDEQAARLCRYVYRALSQMATARALAIVLVLAGASLLVRLLNAHLFYGFFAGDDVEIHEMTFAALFGYPWDIWGLRNAFYPMTFIYPIQWLLREAGQDDPRSLIFAGRAVVALFSASSLVVLFRAARREFGTEAALLAVAILSFSALHVTMGSTELPRPVAAFFLILAFGLSGRAGAMSAVIAGVSVAVAGAMRFSEAVFIVPCAVGLAVEGRWRHAALATGAFTAAWLLILGTADWLYWGIPFQSLTSAVDYGVVRGLSSRGYQPFHYYFSHIPEWSNFFVVGLGLIAWRFGGWRPALWAWAPIVALSLVTHKEPRYLVPVLPFMALAGGVTLRELLKRVHLGDNRRTLRLALVLVVGSVSALLFEASRFRFERSEDAIDLAVASRAEWARDGVAIEQPWRVGGRLYIPDVPTALEIVPERREEAGYLEQIASNPGVGWILVRDEGLDPAIVERLRPYGFRDAEAGHAFYRVLSRQ